MFPRIKCEVPVVFSVDETDDVCSAIMRNYSEAGLYLETTCPLDGTEKITVKTDEESVLDPVGSGTWCFRNAEVRWCLEIAGSSPKKYGCGVQYLPEENDAQNKTGADGAGK